MLPSPADREASSGGRPPPYLRRRPERTLLYQLVEEYYPAFKQHLESQDASLPGYVEQEFEEYFKCGRLEHGFLRVLSVPYPLRFLFASRPEVMGRVLGIVYRSIATHLIKKAGFSRKMARTGAVTLIQRFCWVRAPTSAELAGLTQNLARRIGRFLERQGLLERDAENSYLAGDDLEAGPMEQLLGSSITYRIAVGPQQGRKVFTLQTLPACEEPFDDGVGKVAGFSLHAGVAARADG